jgi:hypothetical protein
MTVCVPADNVASATKFYDSGMDWDPTHLKGLPGHSTVPRSPVVSPREEDSMAQDVVPGFLWTVSVQCRQYVKATHVAELCLANNALQDADLALLCYGLRQLSNLRKLDLSSNRHVTWRGLAALAQVLRTTTILEASSSLACAGAGHLALQELHLDNISVGEVGAQLLCSVLAANTAMQMLSMNECSITDKSAAGFQNVLFSNSTLKTLLLDRNRCARY